MGAPYVPPPVSCRYGAPMGRAGTCGSPDEGAKLRLCRVYLNSGGYDRGGAYWGLGAPMWRAATDDADFETFFRAPTRDAAKAQLLEDYPTVRFYR